jgi:hypothetical protein
MQRGILATKDGSSKHLIKYVFPISNQKWNSRTTFAPRSVFGPLEKGEISGDTLCGYNGAVFSAFFSGNLELVKARVQKERGELIGGFCFLHMGEICATGEISGRIVKLELKNRLPKPFFEGGNEIPKKVLEQLQMESLPTSWKLETPGLEMKVPWDFLVKALHYFEIARATGSGLTLIIPSYEYGVSCGASAELLGIPKKDVEDKVVLIAEKYSSFLMKIKDAFFTEVPTTIILTHNPEFRNVLGNFMENYPLIAKTKPDSGSGFIIGATKDQIQATRLLCSDESESYLALFSYIFGSEKPTILMMHGRDIEGYPLEGMEGATEQFGPERIKNNVALMGVPSAPIITVKGNSFPLIVSRGEFGGIYGSDSKELAAREENFPPYADSRRDGYFSLSNEWLSSYPLAEDIGRLMTAGDGYCSFFIYVKNLWLYTGIPEAEVRGALKMCSSNKSHEGCKQVFKAVHEGIRRKLND